MHPGHDQRAWHSEKLDHMRSTAPAHRTPMENGVHGDVFFWLLTTQQSLSTTTPFNESFGALEVTVFEHG